MTGPQSYMPDLIGPDAFTDDEAMVEFVVGVLEASTEYSIIATDDAGVIQLWNEGARRLYGYSSSEIIGQPKSILSAPEDALAGQPQATMAHARAHGKWEGTVERVRKDGSSFTARVLVTPRHATDGTPSGFLLMSRDVTEELRMTAELARLQSTRSALENAPYAMLIVDPAGGIQFANAETERLFGYTREELIGRPVEKLVPGQYRECHPQHRSEFFSEPRVRPMGAGLDLSGRRRDGSEFPIEISLSPLETRDGMLATAAIRDVTEHKRFEHSLREANTKLEAASRAKDGFLASMSHELRTPLNAILGFTGTLLMGLPGPLNDEQTKQLRTVQAGGRHLLSLINDLLDLARIEAGKLELHVESITCQQLLEEVAVGLKPLADAKGLELTVLAPPDSLEIRSDRRALSQILINLTNNAIKFTDQGSVRLEVTRSTQDDAPVTLFSVIDSGCGIKPSDQARLFAAFEQIDTPSAKPYEGTGLGLYICQTLATFIGASITFASEYGRGSTFTLALLE